MAVKHCRQRFSEKRSAKDTLRTKIRSLTCMTTGATQPPDQVHFFNTFVAQNKNHINE
jgi:hypothetical protein